MLNKNRNFIINVKALSIFLHYSDFRNSRSGLIRKQFEGSKKNSNSLF